MDLNHKTMVYRYFSEDFLCRKDKGKKVGNFRRKTIKFLKRCNLVLKLLHDDNGIMTAIALRKKIYYIENNYTNDINLLDIKTSNRLFQYMKEEQIINTHYFNVPTSNGIHEQVWIISLPQVHKNSKKIKEFVTEKITNTVKKKIFLTNYYLIENQPFLKIKKIFSKIGGQRSLLTFLIFGYLKPKMFRVRILHEFLVKQYINNYEWKFPKKKMNIYPDSDSKTNVSSIILTKNQAKTNFTVHKKILKKITGTLYLQLIGCEEKNKDLCSRENQDKFIEQFPKKLHKKITNIKSILLRQLRLLVDTLRRMKLIHIKTKKF